ncbi:Integrase catalytic core protein [Phytophthora palmivora]|uniref:Integrase catalytic core protein n=1 Tax=Phytophthora palmivora TaxID=4796 RepID=A0A2P4YPK1_9STRA|nr:Integrase catalytic core protein [Phytophthora palmivora]
MAHIETKDPFGFVGSHVVRRQPRKGGEEHGWLTRYDEALDCYTLFVPGGGEPRLLARGEVMKFLKGYHYQQVFGCEAASTSSRNLFSVGRFTKDVGPVTFERDGCFAETKKIKWQLGAREGKGLFKLCMTPIMPDEANVSSSKDRKGDTTSYLWHLRLGHIGHGGLDAIVKKGYGVGINMTAVKQWELCDGCALGKQTRVRYMPKSPNHAKKLLEVIHSDVCGPMKTSTFSGKKYFVTFIDEYSQFCVVYLLRNKSEVAAKFAEFVAFAETQTGGRVRTLRVKQLRSDNGGEYKSREMAKFC